jgi:ankyrin repeat protein
MEISETFSPFNSLPQFANLLQLKLRAKELQKSFDAGNDQARELVRFHLPKHGSAETLKLAHAQFVIARSYGFKSWSQLKHYVEARALTDENAGDALLKRLFESNDYLLAAVYKRCREITPPNIYVAAALADRDAVAMFLAQSPELVNTSGGPLSCTPLVYLCHGRFARIDESFTDRQLAIARDLLDRDADPNAMARREDGAHGWSALYGTCRHPGNPELCALLLEYGAKVSDGESLYHASELKDLRCLQLLLEHGPEDKDREYCIRRMIDHENAAGIALYIKYGTDPNHLDWALFRRRSIKCIRLLLECGADVNRVCKANWLLQRVDGLTPIRIAERNGDPEVTRLILDAGADDNRTPSDFLIGACVHGDRPEVERLLAAHPGLMKSLTANDHSNIAAMAGRGNIRAVETMLDIGFNIDARADDLICSALVYASGNGDVAMTKLLLDRGADRTVKNSYGGNALGTALWRVANAPNPSGDYPGVVKLLLGAGLPLHEDMLPFALDHGLPEIEAILLEHSAAMQQGEQAEQP